jgi:HrpA-like RNA helicase
MLVYAAMLQCTDPLLTIAAALAHGRPVFLSPPNQEASVVQSDIICAACDTKSDHLATVFAFNQYRRLRGQEGFQAARRWCMESYMSAEAMDVIWTSRVEFAKSLSELGFVDAGMLDEVHYVTAYCFMCSVMHGLCQSQVPANPQRSVGRAN